MEGLQGATWLDVLSGLLMLLRQGLLEFLIRAVPESLSELVSEGGDDVAAVVEEAEETLGVLLQWVADVRKPELLQGMIVVVVLLLYNCTVVHLQSNVSMWP